jgi:ribonuclease VapC
VSRVVLDTSAILAVAFNEEGSATVLKQRANAIVSAVNQLEAISKLLQFDMAAADIDIFLSAVFPDVIAFDKHQAALAAEIHHQNRQHRISFADSSCMALARLHKIPVLTADRKWTTIPLDVDVQLVRSQ